jgi:2-C-methyl-D-erythritol 4-phosphate cytidylyltransferase/2-C-methyl-D-erythritol 2,4-cyclodiphosphate synthase
VRNISYNFSFDNFFLLSSEYQGSKMYNFVTIYGKIGVYLSDITVILLSAGNATRFRSDKTTHYPKKQWLYSGNQPLWLHVAKEFEALGFDDIVVVAAQEELEYMQSFATYRFVKGGDTRQASLTYALKNVESDYVLVNDTARCCIDGAIIERIMYAKGDCVVPVLNAVDTLYYDAKPLERERVKMIQTPQKSNTQRLKEALAQGRDFSDESSAIASMGGEVVFVEGSPLAHKLTLISDLSQLPCLSVPAPTQFVGFGVDIHPFEAGKTMKLCGVAIDSVDFGFQAHSDGDVAIHALIDALLGACGMGDIGMLYPDSDHQYANIDSTILLVDTVAKIRSVGFAIINVDMTIMAQTPRLLPYKEAMKQRLSQLLAIEKRYINIKATTAEKLGFVGRKEGVMVQAVANLHYFDWSKI